jgi:hypothetical protein
MRRTNPTTSGRQRTTPARVASAALALAGTLAVASCAPRPAGRAPAPANRAVAPSPAAPSAKSLPPPAEPSRVEPAAAETRRAETPAPDPVPAPPTVAPDRSLPAWWIDAPARAGGTVTVAAQVEAGTLLETRRAAVEAAVAALRAALGREPADPETLKYSVVQLSDGRLRGFILMACAE